MLSKRLLIIAGLSLMLFIFACSSEQETMPEEKPTAEMAKTDSETEAAQPWNEVCPVCAGEVTGELETVTYEGKVYGFGCAGCPEAFKENPEKYVKNLNEDGTKFIGG